jgi:PAS domain S-box-containing protein
LEEALFQLEERARECFISEERFRKIFEAAGDCIFLKDRDFRYDQVNPFMLNLLGLTSRDVIGKTDMDLFDREVGYHSQRLEQKVIQGESIESEQRLEITGVPYTFSFARFPLEDRAGEILGICGIGRDITDRKKSESEIGQIDSECNSPIMRDTLAQINAAATAEGAVLMLGESGAGKDYWAKYLHDRSKRASGPYWAVNCAALAPELVESELFGHEKGAFTGATRKKRGMLELAEGGTILLNEIGEMPLALQSKLLAFLDTRSFNRLGGEDMIFVDSRIVAATNRDLIESVEKGEFRKDLFYRLNVFTIIIPPLRDRIEDLPILAKQLIDEICYNMGLSVGPRLDKRAVSVLMEYNWPGNIRELRNVLERAIILGKGSKVISERMVNLDHGFTNPALEQEGAISHELKVSESNPFHEAFKAARRAVIQEALDICGGNVSAAARMLGIPRGSLRTQMRSLDMG